MRIIFDSDSDTLRILLRDGPIAESDEATPGIILDYDDSGRLVGIEILAASSQEIDFRAIAFERMDTLPSPPHP
jgi:YD repeat-containing protein